MKEPKRRHSLSGTVLIMILTVMAVLIIILMTTLTVVTTANQRIFTKYEENQAYYSARSALDVFTAEMLADSDYYAYDPNSASIIQYWYTNTQATPAAPDHANMKQGLAMQGEIYKIRSKGETTAKVAVTYGSSYVDGSGNPTDAAYAALGVAENIKLGDNVFGGSTPEDYFFSIKGDGTASDPYVDSITYTVNYPKLDDGSDSYGKMVDDNVATVKVEVLDRVYDMSPAYSRDDIINGVVSQTQVASAVAAGDRTKDKLRIKITATTTFNGIEGTAVLILDSSAAPQVSSSRAVTSLSDLKKGTSFNLVGGASSLTSVFTFHNDAVIVGDIFAIGGMTSGSSMKGHMTDDDTQLVTMGRMILSDGNNPYIEGNGVVIYAYDGIQPWNSGDFGSTGHLVNLITPGTICFGGNNSGFYGNVFADDFDITSANTANLRIHGNTYINNLALQPGWIEESAAADLTTGLRSVTLKVTSFASVFDGNHTIAKSFSARTTTTNWDAAYEKNVQTINTDDVYEITSTSPLQATKISTGEVFTVLFDDGSSNALNFDTGKEVKVDYFTSSHFGGSLTSELKKEFTLPGDTAGASVSNKLTLPTLQSLYGDYFDASLFNAEGEFAALSISDLKDAIYDEANGNTTKKDNAQSWVTSNIQTAQDKNGGTPLDSLSNTVVLETPLAGEFDPAITKVIRSSGMLESKDYSASGDIIAIDATSSNITLQLGDGTNATLSDIWLWDSLTGSYVVKGFKLQGKFIIYGDKNVTITLPESPTGSQIIYQFDTSEGKPCYIAHNSLLNISEIGNGSSSVSYSLGKGGSTVAPNVDILAGNNTQISLGTKSFITGYFYCPQSDFEIAGGANGVEYNFNYSGKTYPSGQGVPTQFNVIGSVLCKGYSSSQRIGVCYIGREQSALQAGEPILNWQNVQYARS